MVPRLQNERRYSCLRTERPPTAASKVMRCFFMRGGHITAVELLPGLNDVEAVAKSHELFEARKREAGYEGFEDAPLARPFCADLAAATYCPGPLWFPR
jgi:hypothetical protein